MFKTNFLETQMKIAFLFAVFPTFSQAIGICSEQMCSICDQQTSDFPKFWKKFCKKERQIKNCCIRFQQSSGAIVASVDFDAGLMTSRTEERVTTKPEKNKRFIIFGSIALGLLAFFIIGNFTFQKISKRKLLSSKNNRN